MFSGALYLRKCRLQPWAMERLEVVKRRERRQYVIAPPRWLSLRALVVQTPHMPKKGVVISVTPWV